MSALNPAGKQISGDTGAILRTQFRTDASAIVVVEKDAIFQRLTNDRFFDCVPCILITAKGMPDLGTRVFSTPLQLETAEPGRGWSGHR